MARYKYLGEPPRPRCVRQYGNTVAIVFHLKDGTRYKLDAPNPTTGFVAGETINYDALDERVLRALDADPRFERI